MELRRGWTATAKSTVYQGTKILVNSALCVKRSQHWNMSSGTESGSDNADERVTVGVGLIESVGGGGDGPATEAATAGAAAAGTHDYTPVNFKWIGRGPAVEGASAVDPHMANGRPRMLPPWRCKTCKTKNFQSRLVS